MNKLTKTQIDKAVNWWAEVIQKPRFDNGDKSEAGFIGSIFASVAQSKFTPSQEQVEKFKMYLKEELEKEGYFVFDGLHVDYHPEKILSDAAQKANISELNFPWKTSMWFRDDKVIVAYGYSDKPTEI